MTITFNSERDLSTEYKRILLDSVEIYIIVGNKNPILALENEEEKIEYLNNSTL